MSTALPASRALSDVARSAVVRRLAPAGVAVAGVAVAVLLAVSAVGCGGPSGTSAHSHSARTPSAHAAPAPAHDNARKQTSAAFDYAERTLANGLRIIVLEDHNTPVAQVQVWYHVGSKNEDPERQGFAHMFEHMMFRGTDVVPMGQFDQLLRKVGSDNNAYTFFDQTVYHQKVPANQLDLALFLEADRMASLKIDQSAFDTERAVVEEERRQGLNSPYGTIFERTIPSIFREHPYRWTPIGRIPHLRKATIEELARFWETYYVPNNATLVVVGAVNKRDVLDQAERYFSWIPRGAEVPKVTVREPEQTAPRELRLAEPKGPLPMVDLWYRSVPAPHPDAIALELALDILADGESSRLYRLLVKDRETALSVYAQTLALEQDGVSGLSTTVNPEKAQPTEMAAALLEQIALLRTQGVTDEELDKAKLNLLKSRVTEAQGVEAKSELLGTYAVIYGDLARVNRRFDEIRAVTAADIQRVANTYLVDARRTLVYVDPIAPGAELLKAAPITEADGPPAVRREGNPTPARQGPKAAAVRPNAFPTTAPVARLSTELPKPKTAERVLSNGLRVVSVPRRDLPLVTMMLAVRHGATTEPDDKVGHAAMAAALITQGTENFTSDQLADLLERNAISLSASVGKDDGSVSASCLTEQSDLTMKLLAEVTIRPTFPEREFELAREQTLAGLTVSEQEPKFLAQRELDRRLFAGHPYARQPGGTSADVAKLQREGLSAWWKTHVRPDTCVLYVAGDLDPEKAFALAEKHLGAWRVTGPAPTPVTARPAAPSGTRIFLVDRPGLVQSEIRIAQPAVKRTDPRWGSVRVLSQIFGESFTSRLNDRVRVREGLTYGVSGFVRADRLAGTLLIDTFSKTESTVATVRSCIDELVRMKSAPPTADELDTTKSFLIGSFPGRRETAQDNVTDLWMIESQGLPPDFLEATLRTAGKTTADDVLTLARSFMDASNLTIVIVGDASKIKPELEKIAPVTVVEAPTP